jgi:hypothetical protein
MEWIDLIAKLLPLVPAPGAAEASIFVPIVLELIGSIKSQSGMTTDQIFQRAQIQLDENRRMLLEDFDRLRADGPVLPN